MGVNMDARYARRPRVVQILGGVAAEARWVYLFNSFTDRDGSEDLAPAMDELLGWAEYELMFGGARPDFAAAKKFIGEDDWRPYVREALEIVHDEWPSLHRLASVLFEERCLDARSAWAALGKPPNRRPRSPAAPS